MKTIFRMPGAEYAYAQVETSDGSPFDVTREIRDMDGTFWTAVGNALAQGCALVALGTLQPHVIEETGPDDYADPAGTPQWAEHPQQQTQGYQAPQGGYQPQQATYQQAPQTPPGQQAPNCQMHGRPADYKAAGVSKKTNRPYNAFWACTAGDNNCTRASNFPRL